ncbi:MAG: hypothetical protein IJ400_03490 [Clostridia bacterium]|nr:hypothetical protein [Clostridia bacterium]
MRLTEELIAKIKRAIKPVELAPTMGVYSNSCDNTCAHSCKANCAIGCAAKCANEYC